MSRGGLTARDEPNAQDAFVQLMSALIAPTLHELGFKGKGPRVFWYRRGDYEAVFRNQKSRASTRHQVRFWVYVSAVHRPTKSTYWTALLPSLIPGNESLTSWTVDAAGPLEPTADHILRVFRDYGWPALQAALDSPGYPPDPTISWARTYRLDRRSSAQGGIECSSPHDANREGTLFADLLDQDEVTRVLTVVEIGNHELSDPRAVPALLSALEHDPSADVRMRTALALRLIAGQPEVRLAFQAAAVQDEDYKVRWAARYGLRLAKCAAPSGH